MIEKIQIVKCTDKHMWYRDCVGKTYQVLKEFNDSFLVLADDGYTNIIMKNDCKTSQLQVTILRCSNPVFWYNDQVGKTFDVSFETDVAVWVKIPGNQNAWIYKSDIKE